MFHRFSRDLSAERKTIFVSVNRIQKQKQKMPCFAGHRIYTPMWRSATSAPVLRAPTPLSVSRHGAIGASVLVCKLPDTLSLDYKTLAV